MYGIHLRVSELYISQLLPVFVSILSIWIIRTLARLLLKPNSKKIATLGTSQDTDVISESPLSQAESSSPATLHASGPTLLPLKDPAASSQTFFMGSHGFTISGSHFTLAMYTPDINFTLGGNGHHLNIIGISPFSNSDTEADVRYIVYERAHRRDTRCLLAAALVTGEKETSAVGLRTVYGIASALAHLFKSRVSAVILLIGCCQNFDTFSDDSGHTVVCFTPNIVDTDTRLKRHTDEITLCNSLIKKIFTEANHTIWRENFDRYALRDLTIDQLGFNSDYRNQSEGSAAELESPQASESDRKSSSQPRRELRWQSLYFNMPLSDISEVYGDFLLDSAFDASPSAIQPLPRRLGISTSGISGRKCEGYRREEVTLTPDAFRNRVMVYREPSLNEMCVLCGRVVTMEKRYVAIPGAILKRHRSFGTRKHICYFCGADFTTNQKLRHHTNTHKGVKLPRNILLHAPETAPNKTSTR
ncbi:hypothetical protein BDP27DRAFT_1450093 [Rhodocollybia butyracea]|uniref:C2H2-type domain-containing protein n=1 Tax=Rhodocollybia butyracea TaxID=206335 RepID=A0A9P5U4K4_9AGAR|nr:hypothetical protein BDP27DRAFT_1450093 [Rhodocollybia butyracea]